MNFIELRNGIRANLLTVCDNVTELFVHPDDMASLQANFPYITIVFGQGTIISRRIEQAISIIGFVKGDMDDIPDKIIALKDNIYNALYNKAPKLNIVSQDLTNLFRPFGLDAGIGVPYGGVRFECIVPGIIAPE